MDLETSTLPNVLRLKSILPFAYIAEVIYESRDDEVWKPSIICIMPLGIRKGSPIE